MPLVIVRVIVITALANVTIVHVRVTIVHVFVTIVHVIVTIVHATAIMHVFAHAIIKDGKWQ